MSVAPTIINNNGTLYINTFDIEDPSVNIQLDINKSKLKDIIADKKVSFKLNIYSNSFSLGQRFKDSLLVSIPAIIIDNADNIINFLFQKVVSSLDIKSINKSEIKFLYEVIGETEEGTFSILDLNELIIHKELEVKE